MKTCGKCASSLSLDAFGRHGKSPDGRQAWCRSCQSEYGRVRRAELAAREDISLPATKWCPRCETVKAADQFHKHKQTRDGLQAYCAGCSLMARREWEHRHAEAVAGKRAEKVARAAQRPDGVKTCTKCGETKPVLSFYLHRGTKDGRATYCAECQKAHTRAWNAANREKIAARNAAWSAANPGRKKRDHRQYWLKMYGLDQEAYNAMLAAQDGLCAICQHPESYIDARTGDPRKLAVDHCHKTGRVRGLLCGRCNRGIGQFADDSSRVERAAAYLRGVAE